MRADPPTLVGLSENTQPAASGFDPVLAMICTALVVGSALVVWLAWRWWASRATRSVRSSAVFVTMCRGLKLTAEDRRLLKKLARESGSITPVTMILCPSVFDRAALKAGRSVNKDAVHRLRQRLAA